MDLTTDRDVRLAHSKDASGIQLIPESVARAETAAHVAEIIRTVGGRKSTVTPAGSQTSMTAASITDRGTLLSLSGMKRILDVDTVRRTARVEPGLTIGELNRAVKETGLHFAPDPTSENDATIGGAIACNASGARSLRNGPTRRHVRGVTVVNADGSVTSHTRSVLEKNTVGYAGVQDPVDWYVGSEGTLGIVVEAELALIPLPAQLVGLAVPFASLTHALEFVVAGREASSRVALCLEIFDEAAVAIAGDACGRPWDETVKAMVYLEDDAGAQSLDSVFDEWLAIAEAHQAIVGDIRVFDGASALREARELRHAVPATMNERGGRHSANGGRKVSTDWAVPYRQLATALDISRDASRRHGAPEPVTYGHAGNGHPHQNFIAENPDALARIHEAIKETLQSVFKMGGTFSAEHGLGKLKKEWLGLQLHSQQIEMMRAIKHSLDPAGIFSPGNIL